MNLYDKRDEAELKAIEYLRNTLYKGDEDSCPTYLSLDLAHTIRRYSREEYDDNLKVFKRLFAADDDEIKAALWNAITIVLKSDKFYKRDFTADEYEFLTKRAAAEISSSDPNCNKINAPIETARLILRPVDLDTDEDAFITHFKNDRDLELYIAGCQVTDGIIYMYAKRTFPTLFTIEEKTTRNVIGNVGLSIPDIDADQAAQVGMLEYYIFEEYRHKGYCKEAAKALIDAALGGRMITNTESIYRYVYTRETLKLNAVKATIKSANIPSIKAIESLGFLHEQTVKREMFIDTLITDKDSALNVKKKLNADADGCITEEIYYLPLPTE